MVNFQANIDGGPNLHPFQSFLGTQLCKNASPNMAIKTIVKSMVNPLGMQLRVFFPLSLARSKSRLRSKSRWDQ
jgi:hypothetical protein